MNAVGETREVRLRGNPSLAFPHHDAVAGPAPAGGAEPTVLLNFGALVGAGAPCPDYLLDLVCQQLNEMDRDESVAFRDFLDIFNERLAQLFLAALFKYDYPLLARPDATDAISRLLLCIAGLAPLDWPRSTALAPREMLRYVGIFSFAMGSAHGLEGLLSDYFDGIPFRLECNVLAWHRVPDEGARSRRNALGSRNSTLSRDMILGAYIPDRNHHFRIHVGPLTMEEYLSFIPSGRRRRELVRLVRLYAPPQLTFDLELHILGTEIRPLVLGEGAQSLLGCTSWMVSLARDDDAVRFAVGRHE